jgi:hypothetical protein
MRECDFALELSQEALHELKSILGDGSCGVSVKLSRDAQQFAIKVIEALSLVIRLPDSTEGVVGVIQGQSHLADCEETSSDADRPDRIQPVGVLKHLALDRGRHDAAGKRVMSDTLANCEDRALGKTLAVKDQRSLLGADFTREVGLRVILGVVE